MDPSLSPQNKISSAKKARRKPLTVVSVAKELHDAYGWETVYHDPFYQRILDAGFSVPTIKQAFVLATIAEKLGPISLRGAFYRAVSAGVFADTDEKYYRAAGTIMLKLRRRDCVQYSQIVDSTRRRDKPSSWSGLSDFLETVSTAYRLDLWGRQAECIEFFVEKDAMAGVLQPITHEYDVPLNIIRGDASETFVWNIAEAWNKIKKPICAYYLGDHDPSGIRIERTLKSKLTKFCPAGFSWQRLAITEADFFSPELLGFKIKGNRKSRVWQTKHRDYLERFGDRCIEVDALSPEVIRGRVRDAIESHIDQAEWGKLREIEALEKESVQRFVLAQKSASDGDNP